MILSKSARFQLIVLQYLILINISKSTIYYPKNNKVGIIKTASTANNKYLANDLPDFLSAALSSIAVATATPHSSALHMKKSFCVIELGTYFSLY